MADADDFETWARESQQVFCQNLGDREWDLFRKDDYKLLKLKVAFAINGPPSKMLDGDNIGYTKKEMAEVEIICKAIKFVGEEDDNIYFATIFISGEMTILEKTLQGHLPVFKVRPRRGNGRIFISITGEVYECLRDVSVLTLSEKSIYPRDGVYISDNAGNVMLDKSHRVPDEDADQWVEKRLPDKADWFSEVPSKHRDCPPFSDFYTLAAKADKDGLDSVSQLEIYQLTVSTFFFAHALIRLETASDIIKEIRLKFQDLIRDNSKPDNEKCMEAFKSLVKYASIGKVERRKKILEIKYIYKPEEYFATMSLLRGELHHHVTQLTDDSLIEINKDLIIHPLKYRSMSDKKLRKLLLNATKYFYENKITMDERDSKVKDILKDHRLRFESQREEVKENLCKAFGASSVSVIKIGEEAIFIDLKPHEIDRIGQVMKGAGRDYDEKFLDLVNSFAATNSCKTSRDYCSFMEYVNESINEKQRIMEQAFNEKLEAAKRLAKSKRDKFDVNQIYKAYGFPIENQPITRKGKKNFFHNKIMSDPNLVAEMTESYQDLLKDVASLNREINPSFASDHAATYHYFKHKVFGDQVLTTDQYFDIVSAVCQKAIIDRGKSMLSQEGNVTFITFEDSEKGIVAVVIESHQGVEERYGVATVFYDKRVITIQGDSSVASVEGKIESLAV